MKRALLCLTTLLLPLAVGGTQEVGLNRVAEQARQAWHGQDVSGLLGFGTHFLLQLPGAAPSAPVGRQQAATLLRGLFERAVEVETSIGDEQEVSAGTGYVELHRRYRTQGTQQAREQLVLLSYRRENGGWVLAEIRVTE